MAQMDTNAIKGLVNNKPFWTEDQEEVLRQPYNHLASCPGKNFRTELIRVFNMIYKLPEDKITVIAKFVEILHTSSLLIDDIEDASQWRRGKKAAHTVYGIPMTINTANYMYFYAMECLQELAAGTDEVVLNKLLIIFNQEMMNLHRGQGLDIYWRDEFVVPDEQAYLDMVMNKTGGLFRLTVRIMEVFAPNFSDQKSLVPLSNLLGILYQIRDDYMNLQDTEMIKNKGYAEDVSEGKMSFPIIHGIQFGRAHNDTLVLDILKQRTHDDAVKRTLVAYLEDTSGSMKYTRMKISELTNLINAEYLPLDHDDEGIYSILRSIVDRLSAI